MEVIVYLHIHRTATTRQHLHLDFGFIADFLCLLVLYLTYDLRSLLIVVMMEFVVIISGCCGVVNCFCCYCCCQYCCCCYCGEAGGGDGGNYERCSDSGGGDIGSGDSDGGGKEWLNTCLNGFPGVGVIAGRLLFLRGISISLQGCVVGLRVIKQ